MSDNQNSPAEDTSAAASPALPAATVEQVKAAEAIASQLDPDIAAAIAQGNNAVIQAVAGGATTNTQIAERLISMGITTGLPPGVQALVTEHQQKNDQARKDEELSAERRKDALAAMVGGAAMGTLIAEGGNNISSSSRPSYMQDIFDMNMAQRYNYFSDMKDMSYEQYLAKSDAERQKDIDNIIHDSKERLAEGKAKLSAYNESVQNDPALGDTPEKRKEAAQRIDKLTNIKDRDYQDFDADIKKQLKDGTLTEAEANRARELWDIKRVVYYNENAITQAEKAQEALSQGDTHTAWLLTKDAGAEKDADIRKNIMANTAKYDAATKNGDVAARKSIALQNDESLAQRHETAQPIEQALNKQYDLRNSVDANAAQQVAAQKGDDYGDEAPAQVAAAAPRLTQDLTRLQLAGMLQPEGVELEKAAANDPSASQISAKKPASPASGGMTA